MLFRSDPRNLRLDRGRSDWDVGHSVLLSFSSQLPFRAKWIRGWTLAGSGRAYTGAPFTVRTSNVDLTIGEANRPDRVAKGTVANPSAQRWYDVAAFPVVPVGAYHFGTSGRNVLDGPGFMALNLTMMRNWRIQEFGHLQFRWEAFNVSNHTNFDLPENLVNAQNAGTIVTAGAARQMQVSLKFVF